MTRHSATGLLGRIVNRPVLAHVDMLRFYFGYLARRDSLTGVLVDGEERTDIATLTAAGRYKTNDARTLRTIPDQGIAVIQIEGSLTHKLGAVFPYSGMTGYDGIQAQIETALASPDIKGILLDINSGGGEVSGAFDTADLIGMAAQQKPVWAIADEAAYSAAYLLASQAERVTAPRTAGVGSVGVIALHIDWSRYMANQGAEVSIIKAGAQKAALNPMEPLSEEARAKVQAEVDASYEIFVATVARGMEISADVVRGTEAATLTSAEAKQIGFVDAIQPAADTYAEFAQYLASRGRTYSVPAAHSPRSMESDMTSRLSIAPGTPPVAAPVEQPAAAPAAPPAAPPAAAAPAADPVLAERNRVLAIQTMAQPSESALAQDLIANGSSVEVATLAFRTARANAAEANAAVRRTETPAPVARAAVDLPIDANLPIEQRAKLEWDRDNSLHVEFGHDLTRYIGYRRAEERGDTARIKRGQAAQKVIAGGAAARL